MCRGALTATLASVLVVLLGSNAASAATPQQIYRDLADNGRLDQRYSRADLDRALSNPTIPGYARPDKGERRPQVRPAPGPTGGADDGSAIPFSGLDLALFGVFGAPLLILAASMRRFARTRPRET
jgi:hypothetical protein